MRRLVLFVIRRWFASLKHSRTTTDVVEIDAAGLADVATEAGTHKLTAELRKEAEEG